MKTKPIFLLFIVALLLCPQAWSQYRFSGILVNSTNAETVPYAVINIAGTDSTALTDEKGMFAFFVADSLKHLKFNISVVGYKTEVDYTIAHTTPEKVYITIAPFNLREANIIGFSAKDIVRKAVAAIPDNYADSSYFDYSFYRQYQLVNGRFMNLIETTPVIMRKLKKAKKGIVPSEAFALREIRRTWYFTDMMNEHKDNVADVMASDPVYFLADGALAPNKLLGYTFSYDTTQRSDDYVINYICPKSSSETFGFIGFDLQRAFPGARYETGTIIIDRQSLAFKKVIRKGIRNPRYSFYFSQANFTSDRRYYFEFKNSELVTEYAHHDGKWYPRAIYHKYNSIFSDVISGSTAFDVTDIFEWHSDSTSRFVPGELVKEFYPKLRQYGAYTYNPDFWDTHDFPFYFYNKDTVMKDMEHWGNLNRQFTNQGLKVVDN